MNAEAASRVLSTGEIAWHLAWEGGVLHTESVENRITGRSFAASSSRELGLVLSARVDRVAEPYRQVEDFLVSSARSEGAAGAVFVLRSPSSAIEAELHFRLEGAVRRKWAEVRNAGGGEVLLLDVVLDDISIEAEVDGGGQGQPVFAAGELFAAVEHPSGWNQAEPRRIRLSHCPGRRLPPEVSLRSRTAMVSAAPAGRSLEAFVSYIQERSLRAKKGLVSVYTPFGINNQWGACPTLDDEQILHVLGVLGEWRKKGARFDYFTLDTGWVDPGSDMTRFRPVAFPEGPKQVTERVRELGMAFGLWFATSWASQSCWDHAPAWGGRTQPELTWRNGCAALTDYQGSFCLAAEPYFALLKAAVLHHIRENGARFLKFDGGSYACDDESHGHLPGKYAVERMHDMLIALADAARAEAPDVFVMWYWGLRSPFWAMHGDTIFESGLFMEGSGTSSVPTLHYRDSVSLAQDQNACHARTIPPVAKDSLGVWLADTRWGNYMGRERWREALVMDLGRGNLLFPNLWGDVYLLGDEDVEFLAEMIRWARRNESLLLRPRALLGDPMRNDPYGYAYCEGSRGLVFLNNAHFVSRRVDLPLGPEIGLEARAGARLDVVSRFPDAQRLLRGQGAAPCAGDALEIWLRPFEVLALEIGASVRGAGRLPVRAVDARNCGELGIRLDLREAPLDPDLEVRFADAARFAQASARQEARAFETGLPPLEGEYTSILAVSIRLRREGVEWKYSPAVAEIVQAVARVDDERVAPCAGPGCAPVREHPEGGMLVGRVQDPDAPGLVAEAREARRARVRASGRDRRGRRLGAPEVVERDRASGRGRILRGCAFLRPAGTAVMPARPRPPEARVDGRSGRGYAGGEEAGNGKANRASDRDFRGRAFCPRPLRLRHAPGDRAAGTVRVHRGLCPRHPDHGDHPGIDHRVRASFHHRRQQGEPGPLRSPYQEGAGGRGGRSDEHPFLLEALPPHVSHLLHRLGRLRFLHRGSRD